MAGYKGHIAGAIAINAIYVAVVSLGPSAISNFSSGLLSDWQLLGGLFITAILFGLWPDVDTNSAGQNLFFAIAFTMDILLIVTGRFEAAAYLGLLAMTPIIGKHRGWTHSFIAMLLVPLPIVIVTFAYSPNKVGIGLLIYGAAVAGYFSHLLLDGRVLRKLRIKSTR